MVHRYCTRSGKTDDASVVAFLKVAGGGEKNMECCRLLGSVQDVGRSCEQTKQEKEKIRVGMLSQTLERVSSSFFFFRKDSIITMHNNSNNYE